MLLYFFPRIQSSSTGGEGDLSVGKEKVEEIERGELEMEMESVLERKREREPQTHYEGEARAAIHRCSAGLPEIQGEVKRYITAIKR